MLAPSFDRKVLFCPWSPIHSCAVVNTRGVAAMSDRSAGFGFASLQNVLFLLDIREPVEKKPAILALPPRLWIMLHSESSAIALCKDLATMSALHLYLVRNPEPLA